MRSCNINALLNSKECLKIVKKICKDYDNRMCLNFDVMKELKYFFSDVIMFSFAFNITEFDLLAIYKNKESYLLNKFNELLYIKNGVPDKRKIYTFLNKTLGKNKIIFHGTILSEQNIFQNENTTNILPIKNVEIINNIYEKHGVYCIFEGGIRDYKRNLFYVSTSCDSACFYALQSPEFFARFASRSDYYKWDVYKYDRIAYYRKDYFACKNNIKKEMNEFKFTSSEKKVVLKNFKTIWNSIVNDRLKNVIYYAKLNESNKQKYCKDKSIYEILKSYFKKLNFCYSKSEFSKNVEQIILPNYKQYLKRQNPLFNKKIVVFEKQRFVPDLYINGKYSKKEYFTLKNSNNKLLKTIKDFETLTFEDVVRISNEAIPNTAKGKNFLKNHQIEVCQIENYYKNKFECLLNLLEKSNSIQQKLDIIKIICEDVGLKYVVARKHKDYFKNVNQFNIYEYRKWLGIKLFEHYDGEVLVDVSKINKLKKLYKDILTNKKDILNVDIALQIFKEQIELVK